MKIKFATIQQVINDLKQGKFVIVLDQQNRENEADLVMAADKMTKEKMVFLLRHCSGVVCVPMLQKQADHLQLPLMVKNNTEKFQTAFTVTVDAKDVQGSGIAAADRALTIKKLASQKAQPSDFARPGHVFPLLAHPAGTVGRAGHTEAITDLLRLAKMQPIGVISELMLDNGEMMRGAKLWSFARKHGLKVITVQQIKIHRVQTEKLVKKETETVLPTKFGEFKLWLFSNKVDNKLTPVLIKGEVQNKSLVLTRVHSECLTGEVFRSQRCDCLPQLETALQRINRAKLGLLIYLQQEGRGIGLLDKIRAYKLQDRGLDTVEANVQLGHQADERDYWLAVQILKYLNIKGVQLLTNSPDKVGQLKNYGVRVNKRVALNVKVNKLAQKYLETKKNKLGHYL